MKINLHIEELILRGFHPQDRERIAESLQNELARLLEENHLPDHFGKSIVWPEITGGSMTLRPGERPASLGVKIGRAVYQSVKGQERASNSHSTNRIP